MRKQVCLFLSLLICVSLVIPMASTVSAANASFSSGSGDPITLDVSNATASDGAISAQVNGSTKKFGSISVGNRTESTITITNNNSFDVKLSGNITFTFNGGMFTTSASGSYRINSGSKVSQTSGTKTVDADYILAANGGSMTIWIQSPGGDGCFTSVNWAVEARPYITYNVGFEAAAGGSFTVDGTAITADMAEGERTFSIEGTVGTVLAVTPNADEGYVCIGFKDTATGKLVVGMDTTNSCMFYPGSNVTLAPVFVQGFEETPFSVGEKLYYTWESAMVAGRGKTVLLRQNYVLPSTLPANGMTAAGNYVTGTDNNLTYTIPGGTTFLIPYDENNIARGAGKLYKLEGFNLDGTDFPESPEPSIIRPKAEILAENPSTETRRLTMPANAAMVINGSLEVSAQTHGYGKGQWGKYALIQMEGNNKITISSGGTLYCWGYIRGSGTVESLTGSTVYEPFDIADYPGGGMNTMNDMNEKNVLAFKEYTVHGIEVPLTIHYNTKHYIYFCVTGFAVGYNSYHVPYAGNNTQSLLQLAPGATMIRTYENGRQGIVLSGEAALNAFKISISALVYTYEVDLTKTGFSIPSTWDIILNSGSNVTTNISLPFVDGSTMTIKEGANFIIASDKSVYVFEDAETTTTASVMDVNGTVTVNGGLYTTETPGVIKCTEGNGIVVVNAVGAATSVEIMKDTSTSKVHTITPAKLLNEYTNNGTLSIYTETTETGTYYYHATHKRWIKDGHNFGDWVDTTAANCITAGSQIRTCACGVTESQEIPATGVCVDANADLQCDHCGAYLQVVLAGIEACYDAEVVLRYSLKIPQALLNNENAFVLLTKDSAWDGPVETKYTMAELKAAGVDKDGNYVVAAGTASGEMFRKVTLQVFENDTTPVAVYKQSDASAFESDPAYNVMYYGLATYTNGDEDQKVMMDALLTYGAYAQKKFGVDTENPVDSLLDSQNRTKPDLSTITQDTMTQVSQYDTNNIGIQIRSTEPNLDSRVYLRLAFATDADIDLANYTFELTYRDGNEKKTRTMTTEGTRPEVVYDAEKNVCYAMVYDIPAAYLDNMYTVTITNTTTNQSHSVSTSVICWARQVLIYSSDEATQNLAKALYLYNQAAKTFFKIQEIS